MRSAEEGNWLDDAFDDKKAQEELEAAKGSKSLGCLFAVVLLATVVFIGVAFAGLVGAMAEL